MNIERFLMQRSDSKCELCGGGEHLIVYDVPESPIPGEDSSILLCKVCLEQIDDSEKREPNHWRCLNESMWSTVPAVQVMAWRMLQRLKQEGWPQDLLDIMYLDEDIQEWAAAEGDGIEISDAIVHRDSNGAVLEAGDNVVLIKDLRVKGSSMVAKQGTAVRRILLDYENAEYIEGKVDGQQIVILTKYVKKI